MRLLFENPDEVRFRCLENELFRVVKKCLKSTALNDYALDCITAVILRSTFNLEGAT